MQVQCLDFQLNLVNKTLQWRHNEHDGVSNHKPHGCLPNRLFKRRSTKTSTLRDTGLCLGISLETGYSPGGHKGPVTRKMFSFDDVIMRGLAYTSVFFNLREYQ